MHATIIASITYYFVSIIIVTLLVCLMTLMIRSFRKDLGYYPLNLNVISSIVLPYVGCSMLYIHLLYQKKIKNNYNNCIYYILFYKYYHSNCTGMFNDPIIQERFWLLPIEPQCYLIYSTTI